MILEKGLIPTSPNTNDPSFSRISPRSFKLMISVGQSEKRAAFHYFGPQKGSRVFFQGATQVIYCEVLTKRVGKQE